MAGSILSTVVLGQFEAALSMLKAACRKCPPEHWDAIIGKYPFWQVAYHALCFADCYCAPSNEAWSPSPVFHPAGHKELSEEYPSRRFEQAELLAYADACARIVRDAIERETDESLAGPSGFAWLPISRGELYIYNLRHIQHHAGQLSAALRRLGADTSEGGWVKTGWKP